MPISCPELDYKLCSRSHITSLHYKYSKMLFLSIVIGFSLMICLHGHDVIDIEEHPQSLLIPVNETAHFLCKAHCVPRCLIVWFINGTPNILEFEQEGFLFSRRKNNSSNEYIMTVTINATEAINNTEMHCVFEEPGDNVDGLTVASKAATLLVIAQSPILQNPSVEKNSTHLNLLWSPPFLWPGERIQYYNISTVNKNDSSVVHYRVNSNFSDQVVTFSRLINQNEQCANTSTEIEFSISAVSISGPLSVFNVTEWIHPSQAFCIHNTTTTEAVTSAPSLHTTSSNIFSNNVAFGISLGAATILFLVLMILIACAMRLCSCRFMRRGRRLSNEKSGAHSTMVHNPIYAGLNGGPVYDSVWPLVETVGKNRTLTSIDGFPTTTGHGTTALQERAAGGEYGPNKAQHNESLFW